MTKQSQFGKGSPEGVHYLDGRLVFCCAMHLSLRDFRVDFLGMSFATAVTADPRELRFAYLVGD